LQSAVTRVKSSRSIVAVARTPTFSPGRVLSSLCTTRFCGEDRLASTFSCRRRRLSGSSATFGRQARPMAAYSFVALCLARSSSVRQISCMVSGSEDRRRPRLATTSSPDSPSSETKPPQAGLDRESHRAAAAAFGVKEVDPSPVDVAASPPRGRILPSLVPDESLRRPLRDAAPTPAESAPPSREPKRMSARTLKGKDQASRLPRNSSFSSDENAPLAARPSTKSRRTSHVQSDDGAGASPRVAPTAPSPVVGESEGLVLSAKAKRSDQTAISRDEVRVKPLPDDQRSAMGTNAPTALPSRADDRSPRGRRRTIIARYVFGDELKPGERWKRRLLASR
jgi:hypothetical protein